MIIQDIADQFRSELALLGYNLTDPVIIDGKFHRFSTKPDNPNDTAGWYILYKNLDFVAGTYGDKRQGTKQNWRSSRGKRLTKQERRKLAFEIEEQQKEQEAATAHQHDQVAKLVTRKWNRGHTDFDHQYLRDKNIQPYNIRQLGEGLLIPVFTDGELTSLQYIQPDGTKLFRAGGKIKGGFCTLNSHPGADTIYICEGYATGATLHEHTGSNVIVAFNAGNLAPVAKAIRKQFPTSKIIIAADNDQWTPNNPGKKAGQKAALASKAALILPDFTGLDTSSNPTDFNDLIALGGAI